MKPPPDHGTAAQYQRGCRCRPCTDAAVRDDQLRVLDRIQGKPRSIPSGPVLEHLAALRAGGMNWEQIARAAGTSASTPREIYVDQRSMVLRGTAEKILAVRAGRRPEFGFVNALGARRRVQALYALGHPAQLLSARIGISRYGVALIVGGQRASISAETDRAVMRVYGDLSMLVGDSSKTRLRARREGWAPPLAWNDIDNPIEVPAGPDREDDSLIDPIAVQRALDGKPVTLSRAEMVHVAELMTERGETAEQIAALFGVTPRTVVRWRTANGWVWRGREAA